MTNCQGNQTQSAGMSLLEVLVGIVIFAIGILAITQLQSSLARSAGDANTRTVAINLAESVVERFRGFSRVSKDPDGIEYAYEDIEANGYAALRAGITYNVDIDVADYWYHRPTEQFTTTEPVVAAFSDFKFITVTVDWGDSPEFIIDDATATTDRLGSGSVVLSEIISSITSAADAKSATGGTGGLFVPSINYNPGQNPEIISISLGDNKFKESTTPLPNVIRADELAETTFDVVTYSQNDAGATFLRREEFRAISCNCQLHVPASTEEGGLRPTIWAGSEYTEMEFVSKTYGSSTSNIQSKLCTLCCRDHHDGGTGEDDDPDDPGRARFNPFRSADGYWNDGVLQGDHKHYFRNSSGLLSLAASDGSAYMEACRMVRKDGFWRVGQDLRQEGLNNFPEDYLTRSEDIDVYSGYVTGAVEGYVDEIGDNDNYELNPPLLTPPLSMNPPVVFPASTAGTATHLPTPVGITEQQLRARGIYFDYMSDYLRGVIDCLELGGNGVDCEVPEITTPLEIIPFYDVQLTWLSRWNELPFNHPVDVSNETIVDNNAHSRGRARLMSGTGPSTVSTEIHKGNLGLTGTDPVDENYAQELGRRNLYVEALNETPPPGLNSFLVSGLIRSSIRGFQASDVEISFTGAQCNRNNTGYVCMGESGANNPRITVTNYYKTNKSRVACSDVLELQGSQEGASGWTRFDLPATTTENADIVIKDGGC